MTCKEQNCIHSGICSLEFNRKEQLRHSDNVPCKHFKDNSKYIELPCIAMIEQHLVHGKFVNNSLQNWNGKYAVVYFDKKKSNAPLIDICGKSHYNVDEAQDRLKELKENG